MPSCRRPRSCRLIPYFLYRKTSTPSTSTSSLVPTPHQAEIVVSADPSEAVDDAPGGGELLVKRVRARWRCGRRLTPKPPPKPKPKPPLKPPPSPKPKPSPQPQAGVGEAQVAHEAACPFAICQRMMAPLQAECQALRVENQQLRRQVAALQPLAGRVRALEGKESEGGRRQRQRVGPAPHDESMLQEEEEEEVQVVHGYVSDAVSCDW